MKNGRTYSEEIGDFVGASIPHLTTIVEPWNREKVARLQAAGFTVEILWDREEKNPVGSEIRQMIRSGDLNWRSLVPAACHEIIDNVMQRSS